MDHFDIVKRAWRITWKYRVLWVLGLFVGAGGGGGGGGGGRGYPGNLNNGRNLGTGGAAATQWFQSLGQRLQANLPFIVLAVAGITMLVVALWILSIAARAGLAYLVNEAAEDRPVRARAGSFAAADLEQRIVGRRLRVGRIEQEHAAVLGAEAGGELPVLALDVMDDRRARPGQAATG